VFARAKTWTLWRIETLISQGQAYFENTTKQDFDPSCNSRFWQTILYFTGVWTALVSFRIIGKGGTSQSEREYYVNFISQPIRGSQYKILSSNREAASWDGQLPVVP
jgi:hypothetical protein